MIQTVNIVGGGELGRELNLEAVADDLDAKYDPENFPGIVIDLDQSTCLLFRSGKFVLTGAGDMDTFEKNKNQMLKRLEHLGIIRHTNTSVEIYNKVYKGDLEANVNFESMSVKLGFENIEYEPEQSPFLVYYPPEIDCAITIASSGKLVLNGITSESSAQNAFRLLKEKLLDKSD